MFAKVNSFGIYGVGGYPVTVEVDLSNGLPAFDIVGLPGPAVKEARDRVRAAIRNSGFQYAPSRLTVNLAPADLPKAGPVYDLPILLGILAATGQLKRIPEDAAFAGELSLEGELRPSAGILPMAIEARSRGIRTFFVPEQNAREGAFVQGVDVVPVKDVRQLAEMLEGEREAVPVRASLEEHLSSAEGSQGDFAEVKGQENVKRALEISAAGGHNVLLIGPPGAGKSMLAMRMPSILPPMTATEAMETTRIHSIAGLLTPERPVVATRPFRAPHHTISAAGLSGGGRVPLPGEISLAHNGVLFLDELPEFGKSVLEVLRQPMENREITIARVAGARTYPCRVTVVCAMNPCPCGYYGSGQKECTCTPPMVAHYLSRVSGPLLDRLDMHVDVLPVQYEDLRSPRPAESSAQIRERVIRARRIQAGRFGREDGLNGFMSHREVERYCALTPGAESLLKLAFDRLSLTARSYDRVLRVARTIADLEGSPSVDAPHVAEAVQYRSLDRKYWSNLL